MYKEIKFGTFAACLSFVENVTPLNISDFVVHLVGFNLIVSMHSLALVLYL